MAADGSSEAAGQHGSHARLRHVTLKGVLNTIVSQGITVDYRYTPLGGIQFHFTQMFDKTSLQKECNIAIF